MLGLRSISLGDTDVINIQDVPCGLSLWEDRSLNLPSAFLKNKTDDIMCLRRLTFSQLNSKSPSHIPRGGILAALLGNIESTGGTYRRGLIGLGVNDD